MEKRQKGAPRCPLGLHNKLLNEVEYCHTHRYKWRQMIHDGHCKRLRCPYASKAEYGKWGGKFDNRETKIIG